MSVPQPIGEQTHIQRGVRLSQKLTRIIWLCMFPLFLFAAILAILQIREIHQDHIDKASLLAKNVVLYTDNAINSRIKALRMLATSPLVDDVSKWNDLYLEAQGFYRSFGNHVVITDGNKPPQLLLSTRRPFGTKLPVVKGSSGRLAGPIAMRTGKPAVSDLFDGPVDNQPLIGIAVPVIREGKSKFAILTVLSPEFFQDQIARVSLPPGWHLALKDAQDKTIAQLNQPTEGKWTSHVIADSTVSNWKVEVEIPPVAHWRPMISAGIALAAILLGATLTGFLSGKWAGSRVGKAIESLTATDPLDIAAHDEITEIAAARKLIKKEAGRRRAVENALRENAKALNEKMLEYEAMFERSVVGKAQADPTTGRFMKVNQAFADMTGYSPEELCRMTFVDITHPDDLQRDIQGIESVRMREDDKWHAEKRYLRKDGTSIWVSVSGNVTHFDGEQPVRTIAVIQDITERKVAVEALQASERKYRELVEAANSIILRWDKQGVIRFVNNFGLQFFGYSANELVGRSVMTIVPRVETSSGRDLDALVKDILVHPEQHTYVPNENIKKDGSTAWIAWTNKAILDANGDVCEILAIGNDITALKQTEAELRESEERIRASLTEKEVLLKEIHHRVKNNMQVISSLVELQADEVQDQAICRVLKDVTFRVRSMAMVHEKLYQSDDFAHVDFADYARSLLRYLWQAQAGAIPGVAMKMNLEPVLLPVNEAVPCGLMLNELFTNSLKHAFVGRETGAVTVSLQNGGRGKVVLSVQDDGIGLPLEMDIKNARSLGLRLVQMLARQLRASVEAQHHNGTAFTITFEVPKV